MTNTADILGKIGIFFLLFVFLSMFISGQTINSGVTTVGDLNKVNEESLANIWGDISVDGFVDLVDRSSDTFLLAGLFFIGALAIHSQFRSEPIKEEKMNE